MSSVVISGDTSGAITLAAPAVAGTTTLTLPATTGTVLNDATVGVCRAWVNFNGISTPAIRASFNVTSITKNGTGDYTVNFTTAMLDANYATLFGGQQDDTSQAIFMGLRLTSDTGTGAVVTTTSVRLLSTQAGTATDIYWANIAIFR